MELGENVSNDFRDCISAFLPRLNNSDRLYVYEIYI